MNFIKILKLSFFFLPAILTGAYVAQSAGVSPLAFLPNIIATFFGALLFLVINFWASSIRKNIFYFSLAALFLIFLSFFSPGLESVHRWIKLGPIFLNVSMAFTPVVLYGMACSNGLRPLMLSLPLSFIFIFQPDAGQATAFNLASAITFIFNHNLNRKVRIIGCVFAFSLTYFTWQTTDPLLPVEHVERILHMAFNKGIFIFAFTLISTLLLHFPFILAYLKKSKLMITFLPLSFFTYLLISFLVTQFGNFPVPVIGAGAAPVLGWFLMVSFLAICIVDNR